VISLSLLFLLSPIMFLIAIVTALQMKGRFLFFQERVGLHEKTFVLIKFMTMRPLRHTSIPGTIIEPDKDRLTRYGAFIRASSLDELPTLVNVLRGDMTFVGPRPLVPDYLNLYSMVHRRRHTVKPGITGWAQVNGRNSLSWKDRLDLDIWYVDHRTWQLDLKILGMTIKTVLSQKGVTASGEVAMTRFNGYEEEQQDE
jgi:lipopolysaccharide/colanic/teichoic acid biosynthesis glycosyltransferase